LAEVLARSTIAAAIERDTRTVMLGGGCFYNRLLSERLTTALEATGLQVHHVHGPGPGDAGLALGQAWIAAHALAGGGPGVARKEAVACA
jgi:hydrogenase maturation protein HypF